MKQIIKFLKKMSVENALFFFSMFGVAMMAFAFMGGNMRFLDEGLAIWLIIAGAVVAGVGMIGSSLRTTSLSTTSTRLHRVFRERRITSPVLLLMLGKGGGIC